MNPPGPDQDLIKALTDGIGQLVDCMRRAQRLLKVPAAEYVPAINEAWEELQRGLS